MTLPTASAPPPRPIASRLRVWLVRLALVAITIVVTLIVGGGFDARRRHPELKPWHRLAPLAEPTAADLSEAATLDDYLRREADVFDQVHRDIEVSLAEVDKTPANRFNPQGVSSPARLPTTTTARSSSFRRRCGEERCSFMA